MQFEPSNCPYSSIAQLVERMTAVSYTHLDVYKRQVEGGFNDWG